MTNLTNFQKKKILKVFTMLYDSNNDGVIDKRDFDELLKKICKILDWKVDGLKYKKAKATLETVWTGLLTYADTNDDCQITKEEWLNMWGDCLKDLEKGEFPDWQIKYMDLMFDVNDKSGDDKIDEDEYRTFFSQFGISDFDCKQAFQTISGGNNITHEKFATLWKVYLTSTDTEAPANSLFGPILDE